MACKPLMQNDLVLTDLSLHGLRTLVITDGFNSGGAHTCNFGTSTVMGYDDVGRLLSADCGSAWQQTFSYDQYDNITKSGGSSWAPGYDAATNHALPPITYDNNGNLTYDTLHHYAWYVDNKLGSSDSTTCNIFGSTDGTCVLYDAFGREVERGVNGVYTEVMYTPVGKTAIMNGQTTTTSAYFPLPGGATYYQTGSTNGSGYFWHKDWLGSVRLSSSVQNRTFYFDRAFAPYGEMYKNFGNTAGLNFTGDTQDSFTGLYDTPSRELTPAQGRWLSPDSAGADWNQYGYVRNNPLRFTDPTGMYTCSDDNKCKTKEYIDFEKARQRDLQSKDSAVVAAAKAYGDPTQANGVSVAFAKKLPDSCAGGGGCTQPGITGTAAGGIAPDVKVTFLNNLSGKSFDQAVAHEGSHTADALQFINSFDASTGKFNGTFNYVHYDTEFKAYAIGASVMKGENYSIGTCGGSPCVFRANDSIQDTYRKIDQLLTDPRSSYKRDLEKLQFDRTFFPQVGGEE